MRHLRMLGLVALTIVAALVAAAGASATALTQAPPYTGTVKAEGSIHMHGSVTTICQKSALEWNVESHGASAATAGPLSALTLEECGNRTVTVFNPGRFELHATSNGNGTLTWSNAEVTVQIHSTIFGFPVTTHCIYETDETAVGILTGSSATKGTAELDIYGPIPQKATDAACVNDAYLTGTYKVTSPDYLVVD